MDKEFIYNNKDWYFLSFKAKINTSVQNLWKIS